MTVRGSTEATQLNATRQALVNVTLGEAGLLVFAAGTMVNEDDCGRCGMCFACRQMYCGDCNGAAGIRLSIVRRAGPPMCNKSTTTTPRLQASRSQKPSGCWCSTRRSAPREAVLEIRIYRETVAYPIGSTPGSAGAWQSAGVSITGLPWRGSPSTSPESMRRVVRGGLLGSCRGANGAGFGPTCVARRVCRGPA